MFQAPKLTNAGKDLYYRNMGSEPIKFTTIQMGGGNLSGPIATMTALVNPLVTINAAIKKNADYVEVSGKFSNASIQTGFYWREIGIFAANPADPNNRAADILYCYQNAYDTADYIPVASVETVEKNITVPVIVGDASNVSCTLSGSLVMVTMKDLDDHSNDTTKHVGATTKATPVDADSMVLVDSADGNKLKRFSLAALKSALSSVFAAASHNHNGTYEQVITKKTAFNVDFETIVANIKKDGTASVGSLDTAARADHVHPSDSSKVDVTSKGATGGVAELDVNGKVPAAQLPAMNYDPAGSAADVQKNLNDHTNNKNNPHGVTAAQVGAIIGSVLQISFDRVFLGRPYTVTSAKGERYEGVVPSSLYTEVSVKNINTIYTLTTSDVNGTVWTNPVTTGAYFGQYPVMLGTASQNLNSNTWAKIKEISDSGQASAYWKVGDSKTITINGTVGKATFSNLVIEVFIIGFDHNATREGNNRIHFQIGRINNTEIALKSPGYWTDQTGAGYFHMNESNTNARGWGGSSMRTTLLGNAGTPSNPPTDSLLAALPLDLRNVIKAVTKYSDNAGGGSDLSANVTTTEDYLFLLSEFENHGIRTKANSAEQSYQAQYAYYKAGNSKIKHQHDSLSSAAMTLCRSVSTINGSDFCYISLDGTAGATNATFTAGISAAFCV